MPEERILSADSHVVEPADVWTARIEKRYADRAPRIINEVGDRKGDFFVAEGLTPFPVAAFAVAGVDPKEYKEKMAYGYWGVRPGAWDPVERIKEKTADCARRVSPHTTIGSPTIAHMIASGSPALRSSRWTIPNKQRARWSARPKKVSKAR